MADFKVDTDELKVIISRYNQEVEKLNSIKISIENTLSNLETNGWDSEAGKAAMENFQDTWVKDIVKYRDYVEFLTSILNEASIEFEDLAEKSKELSQID